MKENETQNLISICAVEQDGMETRHLIITLRLLDGPVNIMENVIKACTEYVKTQEGQKTYENNSESFNWADFEAHVPNEICRHYGFEKSDSILCQMEVNWDEHLVDDTHR